MSSIQQSYNIWADQYDTNTNLTRDLEAIALRKTLGDIEFSNVLEIGSGTGKNSEWFITKAKHVTAADFSEQMLNKAKAKITATNINFVQADITKEWSFTNEQFDVISFSLVLEHIQDLDFIFKQIKQKVNKHGYVYIGELHPFKQYQGSLARFDTEKGRVELQCYNHHVSEFLQLAKKYDFTLVDLNEWFDDDKEVITPRILSILLKTN